MTKEFFASSAPYQEIMEITDPFDRNLKINEFAELARNLKFPNFLKTLDSYQKSLKMQASTIIVSSPTQFQNQPIELDAGEWRADEGGISRWNGNFEERACPHPILPVERLVNIDTNEEKLKLAFRKGKQWRYLIVDKGTLASANKVTDLAKSGIAVTSKSAGCFVEYISDIENINYDIIPEKNSVSRLGWITGKEFSPYVDSITFDGDVAFKSFFESVSTRGSLEEWLRMVYDVREGGIYARIILAASFASALVKPLGGLVFFVHLWGGTEVGKTVALMLAASIWGNPDTGRFVRTFNSTSVGWEMSAAFVNSLPLILDEFEITGDRQRFEQTVYMLSEGAGRTRGNKNKGIDTVPTWKNCILTSGEYPITSSSSKGGASNRIVEVECKEKIFESGRNVADCVRKNYGFAGKFFAKYLQVEGNLEEAEKVYKQFYNELSENDTTEKQSMSAALILAGDYMVTKLMFKDDKALTVSEMVEFLKSKSSISQNERGYQYMCEWVSQNANKMRSEIAQGDVYGYVDSEYAYIISSVFNKACEEGGYSRAALLSFLKEKDLIQFRGKRLTRGKRINGILTECVVMRLMQFDNDEVDEEDREIEI